MNAGWEEEEQFPENCVCKDRRAKQTAYLFFIPVIFQVRQLLRHSTASCKNALSDSDVEVRKGKYVFLKEGSRQR